MACNGYRRVTAPPSEREWTRTTSAVFSIGNPVHDARNQCSPSARISVHDGRNPCSRSTGARISVDSEPGHGTTFTIYLPPHVGEAEPARADGAAHPAQRGHETILLVEDEPVILELTKMLLEKQGYTVLAASRPGEAIRLAREHTGEIHLLMTDVIMPEMNGRDLARNLVSVYPHLARLFMSGYTADVIAHHGVLEEGVFFI